MTTQPKVYLPGTTIVFCEEKGGVGKTLLTFTLAVMLCVHLRLRILVVDLCPQGSAGHSLGLPRNKVKRSIFETLLDPEANPIEEVIRPTYIDTRYNRFFNRDDPKAEVVPDEYVALGPDLAPINEKATSGISDLQKDMLWSMRLRQVLEPVKHDYDLVIIDTNPLIGGFIALGLCASEYAVIPVVPEELPTQGLIGLARLIKEASLPQLNPDLQVAGIVFNMVEDWASHASYMAEIRDLAQNKLKYHVFNKILERYPMIATASNKRSAVTMQFPFNRASKVLWNFLLELVAITGGRARDRAPQYIRHLAIEENRQRVERDKRQERKPEETTAFQPGTTIL